ncbi:hypothetical protein RJ641_017682 [Dillenia turbinata]|uniref:Uncharacterized protein n=1 Tax=Dillenia turbinata TaxID=194707 RepID=A0AAN8USS9_9MAGN
MEELLHPPESLALEDRPGILFIGSSSVGKHTLLSRLLGVDDVEDKSNSTSKVIGHGWTIDTKYYTADVSIWMAHLDDEFSLSTFPISHHLVALVMVFDMSELASFASLKDWVSRTEIERFDILLCIGNKVDLLPGHSAHAEYRRCVLGKEDASLDLCTDPMEFGISDTEGVSLLSDDEHHDHSWEIKRSCSEWCTEHNIEFVEACASNLEFDKCLSVHGDLQGVERLYGALSAHMWPGMILKSKNRIIEPLLPEKEELSEDETDIEIEYEILSGGSAEPWDDTFEGWVSATDGSTAAMHVGDTGNKNPAVVEDISNRTNHIRVGSQPSTSATPLPEEVDTGSIQKALDSDQSNEVEEGTCYEFEDLEQLMSEIGNMRDNLRLMPDFQRREIAAQLAMKMAAMFGGSSEDEDGADE